MPFAKCICNKENDVVCLGIIEESKCNGKTIMVDAMTMHRSQRAHKVSVMKAIGIIAKLLHIVFGRSERWQEEFFFLRYDYCTKKMYDKSIYYQI